MKKISNYFLMATVFVMTSVPAFAKNQEICNLLDNLRGVINTLRTLAFLGAMFLLMDWAWNYIKDPSKATKDDMKEKGIGLLVGFFLLFGVGLILHLAGSNVVTDFFDCGVDQWLTNIKK